MPEQSSYLRPAGIYAAMGRWDSLGSKHQCEVTPNANYARDQDYIHITDAATMLQYGRLLGEG